MTINLADVDRIYDERTNTWKLYAVCSPVDYCDGCHDAWPSEELTYHPGPDQYLCPFCR